MMQSACALAFAMLLLTSATALADAEMEALLAEPAAPLDLTISIDEKRAVTALIGPDGGAVEAETTDGAVFRLTVPPGALPVPVEIRLAPLSSIEGMPAADFDENEYIIRRGIDMEPSGLRFAEPAILAYRPPATSADSFFIAIGFDQGGYDAWLRPFTANGDSFETIVHHFSGEAWEELTRKTRFTPPSADETQAEKDQVNELHEQRYQGRLAKLAAIRAREAAKRGEKKIAEGLAAERQCQQLGKDCPPEERARLCKSYEEVMPAFWDATYNELTTPGMTCEKAGATLRKNFEIGRSTELLRCEGEQALDRSKTIKVNGSPREASMIDVVARICDNEAEQMCQKSGQTAELLQTLLGNERQRQFMGSKDTETDEIINKLKTCANYTVVIDNQVKEHWFSGGPCTDHVSARVTMTAELSIAGSLGSFKWSGEARHTISGYANDLQCEDGDDYRLVNAETEQPGRITMDMQVQTVPGRNGATAANIFKYFVKVEPGTIFKRMQAKTPFSGWTPFEWPAWFGDTFSALYQGQPAFVAPETGERPQVGRGSAGGSCTDGCTVDSMISGNITSDIRIIHKPLAVKDGRWDISR